jgi:hypothetical protein
MFPVMQGPPGAYPNPNLQVQMIAQQMASQMMQGGMPPGMDPSMMHDPSMYGVRALRFAASFAASLWEAVFLRAFLERELVLLLFDRLIHHSSPPTSHPSSRGQISMATELPALRA